MKIQLAYGLSGEDKEVTLKDLRDISSVSEKNHSVYCPALDEITKGFSKSESINNALSHIDQNDALITWINSYNLSEGRSLEFGYAKAKNKNLILLLEKNRPHPFRELSNKVIEYKDKNDLLNKLGELK